MTEVVKWVTAVLAIWGALSILVAVFWGLIGRRIFRNPPTRIVRRDGQPMSQREAEGVRYIIDTDLQMRGHRGDR